MSAIEDIIRILELGPHLSEGGYFIETYRSEESLAAAALPARYGRGKSYGTAIYYLLTSGTFSEIHKLPTDEIFHFYLGDPVEMLHLFPDGTGRIVTLGPDIAAGERPQIMIPRDTWQGARLHEGGKFALMGTTMAPGYDNRDYISGKQNELLREYPEFSEKIKALTRA